MDLEDEELFMFNLILILRNRNLPEDENQGRPFPLVDIEWWWRLGDPMFKTHFRMSRITYETLVVVVGRHMRETNRLDYPGMYVDKSLMMTLWILATPDSFRSVGVNFGLAKGSVHNQFKTIIAVLQEISGRYIRWPSNQEMASIARNFETKYGYPSVVGCVDGCHIYI
ncbi:hypothetical protein FOCC_FOCC014117 [Frankliniella occidentalis]|uniref:Uncharacterized protein LOC127750859 n=1 Tax=Frankliniella occidentalis TaxID=133901 RepID=A0A9C6X5E2_FRAOC|nr:uncharacterized protein LOC127750859 [Frankliniella occidentalis]KAE8740379.1 hypothetical protein FOCC_FOCC014117 [Frankliniella occidentalis]